MIGEGTDYSKTKWQLNHHTVEGQEDCVIVVNNDTTYRHHTSNKEGRE